MAFSRGFVVVNCMASPHFHRFPSTPRRTRRRRRAAGPSPPTAPIPASRWKVGWPAVPLNWEEVVLLGARTCKLRRALALAEGYESAACRRLERGGHHSEAERRPRHACLRRCEEHHSDPGRREHCGHFGVRKNQFHNSNRHRQFLLHLLCLTVAVRTPPFALLFRLRELIGVS